MSDWLHKDRLWLGSDNYQDPAAGWLHVDDDDEAVDMSFERWLDWQCKNGWEVIKIHRDFNHPNQGIWCVFRLNP